MLPYFRIKPLNSEVYEIQSTQMRSPPDPLEPWATFGLVNLNTILG